MNSVLDKIFSFKYFGVILFSVIGLLAVLFIILFAVAIKDAKKNKINNNIEEENKESKKESKIKKEEKIKENKKEEKIEEIKDEKIEEKFAEPEIEIPLDDVIESNKVKEDNEIDLGVNLELTLADLDNTLASLNIEKEEKKVEIKQENNDLQDLAMSLVKDYKKEKKTEGLEIKEEKKIEPIAMPNLDDIPMPQAIKVVDQTPINNPTKKRVTKRRTAIDRIVGEEYKLK